MKFQLIDIAQRIASSYCRTKQRVTRWGVLAFGLACLSACDKPEILLNQPNENVRSIGGYLSNNFDFSLFAAALEYTGLLDSLTHGAGPYTVLAPWNGAFQDLGISRNADFLAMDRDSLRQVLAYHILPMRLRDIPPDEIDLRYETLSGDSIYVTSGSGLVYSGAEEIHALSVQNLSFSGNYSKDDLSNGKIIGLVKLMKPFPHLTVQDWLAYRPQHSIFVAGLKKFGLWEELADVGPFTVFAPTNTAMEAAGITEETIASMDVTDYIGARLFGAYISYDRQFFIRDFDFYQTTVAQRYFVHPVRDDEYNFIFMGQAYFSMTSYPDITYYFRRAGILFVPFEYSIGITKDNVPYGYYHTVAEDNERFLGSGTPLIENPLNWLYHINSGVHAYNNDNICNNGIVHQFDAVLVLPEEALVSNE